MVYSFDVTIVDLPPQMSCIISALMKIIHFHKYFPPFSAIIIFLIGCWVIIYIIIFRKCTVLIRRGNYLFETEWGK